jgi:polar amino acid transport system permease protein
VLRYRDAFTLPMFVRAPQWSLLPLGRRWPEGPDEGAFNRGEESRPSPVRPNDLRSRHDGSGSIQRGERDRKPWPHVLSPEGRGGGGSTPCLVVIGHAALLFVLVVGVGATVAVAQQPAAVKATAVEVLVRWAPLLLWGFGFNILISIMAMGIGTVAGVPVGIGQLSRFKFVRFAAGVVTQLFRNSPWLVLLFLCVFLIPFEIRAFGMRIPFPDWAKATMGFALPVMANTSEITRGAILSVATGQWDSARALGLTRRQSLYLVILPQCVKRMLPPWMNLYSLIAMSTVNASIVGVSEMITLTSQVHAAEGSRPELLAPLYAFALVCFFVYCYPIGKWTQALERRYQLK